MSNSYSEIFRPVKPDQLAGETQKSVAKSLLDSVAKGKIIHEILLSGDSGIGKTTIAQMYAKEIMGYDVDFKNDQNVIRLNCSDKTGIDDIRSVMIESMSYMPMSSPYKIYFLDEVHRLSTNAQDALLTEIEPVPSHVIIIACTTNPTKLQATFRSRFDRHHLTPPTIKEFQWLAWAICKKLNRTLDAKIIDEVISVSNGNVRDFDRYLQQVLEGSFTGENLESKPGIELVKLIISGNKDLNQWFNAVSDNMDYVQQATGMVGYSISIIKNNGKSGHLAAEAIIEYFGDQPARTIDSKYTFFNRLLMTHRRISNGRS